MASVRMSERLRDELLQGVEQKFLIADPKPSSDKTLSAVVQQALLEHPAYKKAYDFIKDPVIEAAVKNPLASGIKDALAAFREPKVIRQVIIKGFVFNGKAQDFTSEFPDPPPTMHFGDRWGQQMTVQLDDFPPATRQMLNDAMTTSASAQVSWADRHKTFMDSAKELIKNCNTVGQFLDAWPEAETLLSNDIRQKLNTKVQPTKDLAAAEARAKFDATQASPTLLVAEIVQSAIANPQGSGT